MERIYAFTDESGSFGWDFDNKTVSTHFIVSAIVVKESELENVRNQVEDVRAKCFQTGEMKSSSIGKNHSRRVFVLNELKKISFSVFSVICDKRKLLEINGLQYKESFYKYLNNIVHQELRSVFPVLTIVADEFGGSEYMKSFSKYVKKKQDPLDLFGESDFYFKDSVNEVLIQLADIISGTLAYEYDEHKKVLNAPHFYNIIRDKIIRIEFFPRTYDNYIVQNVDPAKYDNEIATICYKLAYDFIQRNDNSKDEEVKAQVLIVKYLLFRFLNYEYDKYVTTKELKKQLEYTKFSDLSTQKFRMRIIAKLRDNGVIISGSSAKKGYKIPSNEKELLDFINHGTSIIMPMLSRLKKCRDSIKMGTINKLDLFQRTEYKSLKKYFDDIEVHHDQL